MNKCNAFLFTFGVIFLILPVDGRPGQENECGGMAEFSCVSKSECPQNSSDTYISCGFDESSPKICCPSGSKMRRSRQLAPVAKKDPFLIAQQKCLEYSEARYATVTDRPLLPGRPSSNIRKLDCSVKSELIIPTDHAALKEFPHMAMVGHNNRTDGPINETLWHCSGTLISDRYVLTTAHCKSSGGFVATWVRLGELVFDNDRDSAQPKDFRIADRIPHPQYTSSSVYFDIMLLKLAEKVEFTPHMRPICLYTASDLAAAQRNKILVTGWGLTAAGEEKSDSLLKARVRLANDSECTTTYKNDIKLKKGYDPATMICAGDTCYGDSGAPLQVKIPDLVCMYSQVGITSYGSFICGQENANAIYMKISTFIPWIQSIVWP